MIPQNLIKVEGGDARKVFVLMEALEDHDDIQHVWANFDIDEELLAELGAD